MIFGDASKVAVNLQLRPTLCDRHLLRNLLDLTYYALFFAIDRKYADLSYMSLNPSAICSNLTIH